jgi:hypothetical protein
MNMYNFIYCFFYIFWEKRGNDGRIIGAIHVVFAIMMHFALIIEMVSTALNKQILNLPSSGGAGRDKVFYVLCIIPFCIIFWIYYSKSRTMNLLKEYKLNHPYKKTNMLKIIALVIVPMMLAIAANIFRNGFN